MPQLSPLSWIMTPIITWLFLITLSSILWWILVIKFYTNKNMSMKNILSSWPW